MRNRNLMLRRVFRISLFYEFAIIILFASSNMLSAQRFIDFYEPDYDSAYCIHMMMYGWLKDANAFPPLYSQFNSKYSRDHKINTINKKVNLVENPDTVYPNSYYAKNTFEINKFNTEGFIVAGARKYNEVFRRDTYDIVRNDKYLCNNKHNIINVNRIETVTGVIQGRKTIDVNYLEYTYFYNNKKNLDSLIIIDSSVKGKVWTQYRYQYDTSGRITNILKNDTPGNTKYSVVLTNKYFEADTLFFDMGWYNELNKLMKDNTPEKQFLKQNSNDTTDPDIYEYGYNGIKFHFLGINNISSFNKNNALYYFKRDVGDHVIEGNANFYRWDKEGKINYISGYNCGSGTFQVVTGSIDEYFVVRKHKNQWHFNKKRLISGNYGTNDMVFGDITVKLKITNKKGKCFYQYEEIKPKFSTK